MYQKIPWSLGSDFVRDDCWGTAKTGGTTLGESKDGRHDFGEQVDLQDANHSKLRTYLLRLRISRLLVCQMG